MNHLNARSKGKAFRLPTRQLIAKCTFLHLKKKKTLFEEQSKNILKSERGCFLSSYFR